MQEITSSIEGESLAAPFNGCTGPLDRVQSHFGIPQGQGDAVLLDDSFVQQPVIQQCQALQHGADVRCPCSVSECTSTELAHLKQRW